MALSARSKDARAPRDPPSSRTNLVLLLCRCPADPAAATCLDDCRCPLARLLTSAAAGPVCLVKSSTNKSGPKSW
jgi:hypothetical protein